MYCLIFRCVYHSLTQLSEIEHDQGWTLVDKGDFTIKIKVFTDEDEAKNVRRINGQRVRSAEPKKTYEVVGDYHCTSYALSSVPTYRSTTEGLREGITNLRNKEGSKEQKMKSGGTGLGTTDEERRIEQLLYGGDFTVDDLNNTAVSPKSINNNNTLRPSTSGVSPTAISSTASGLTGYGSRPGTQQGGARGGGAAMLLDERDFAMSLLAQYDPELAEGQGEGPGQGLTPPPPLPATETETSPHHHHHHHHREKEKKDKIHVSKEQKKKKHQHQHHSEEEGEEGGGEEQYYAEAAEP